MQKAPRNLDVKHYLSVVISIAVVFLAAGYLVVNTVQNFYNQQAAEETRRVANSYAQRLAIVADAANIIDGLLEDKLIATSQVVAHFDGEYSNHLLAEVAGSMQVDEIYVYDSQGAIRYSNTGKYLGWRAERGHPVYNFMQSKSQSHIGEIRQDTESDNYLKYAYWLIDESGRFLQVGVLADTIHAFLGKFEMQHLLAEMAEDPYVQCVLFYDNDFAVIAGVDHEGTDFSLSTVAKEAISADREYASEIHHDGEHVYQVMLPIFVSGDKLGTLAISHSVAETKAMIGRVSMIGIATLLIIFGFLLAMLYATHRKNETLIRYSYFDAVTGLPNKTYLEEFIQGEQQNGGQKKRACLLVNCNLELLNMAIGYQYSEMMLKECAATLIAVRAAVQQIFHLGAARFLLYISGYEQEQELINLSQQVIDAMRQPLQAKRTGVTIGIVQIDREGLDANTLIKRASIAASHARDDEIDGYRFFDSSMEEQLLRENIIESEIRAAVSSSTSKTIYLHYQPIVDLKQNRIVGLEALARMQSSSLGSVSPAEFIPIAEQTGLIIPLGRLVIRAACEFLAQLEQQGYKKIKISVNISPIQLLRDDFVTDLIESISETGVRAGNLILEITESLLLDEYEAINEKLSALGSHGIEIAIDDFGTGYSSLSRSRELRVHGIKLDKSFIDYLRLLPPERTITQDIIAMAHRQGFYVVAEGVEVPEQREYLLQNNCDFMQGYLFSKPLAPDVALELLRGQG